MPNSDFRIESAYPIVGPFVPMAGRMAHLLNDRELAVVVAAKSETLPAGQEIRVVHVPTGEIIFSKSAATPFGMGSGLCA